MKKQNKSNKKVIVGDKVPDYYAILKQKKEEREREHKIAKENLEKSAQASFMS